MVMLASGVPLTRSDMSAAALLIMALVIVASLAAGLIVVFLADRPPRRRGQSPGQQTAAQPTAQVSGPSEPAGPDGDPGTLPEPAGRAVGSGHERTTGPVPVPAGLGH